MGIRSRLSHAAQILLKGRVTSRNKYEALANVKSSAEYWTAYNVTAHHKFTSREESLAFMRWRFDQYPNYEQLMPCSGFDGKVILDYGCGPGHDVVGFIEHSKPAKVIAMDVSSSSLEQTRKRVELHGTKVHVEVKLIRERETLPLEDNSVDYIHSSGVLHHTPNMEEILREFHRVLKPNGVVRIMVYNQESIWYHLYVPYILQIKQMKFSEMSIEEAFKRSTDEEYCPISNCYTPSEYLAICSNSGFKSRFIGSAVSLDEIDWALNERNNAMRNKSLHEKHRVFLKSLTFNDRLIPYYMGNMAGIDAVYELVK